MLPASMSSKFPSKTACRCSTRYAGTGTRRDGRVAIRYSCINANACKTCMALIDGQVEYTCIAKLLPGIVTVEPLPKRRLIRDLVTDVVPDEEKALLAAKQPD